MNQRTVLRTRAFTEDLLTPFRQQTDPPGDAVIQAVTEAGRHAALGQLMRWLGQPTNASLDGQPEAVRLFFTENAVLPFFADWEKMRRGLQFFKKREGAVALMLGFLSLPYTYLGVNGVQVLMRSGRMLGDTRKRLEELLPLFDPEKLNPVIDIVSKRLKPVLEAMNKDQARGYLGQMEGVKDRLKQRYLGVQKILKTYVEPLPPKFDAKGELLVTGWTEAKETEDTVHEQQKLPGNAIALVLKTGPSKRAIASWRREIILPKGKYEFQALVKTVGVVASPDATQKGSGAGLRISGGTRTNSQDGTAEWKLQRHVFEVTQDNVPVVLIAELRATAGTAMFDTSTLKLVRLKP